MMTILHRAAPTAYASASRSLGDRTGTSSLRRPGTVLGVAVAALMSLTASLAATPSAMAQCPASVPVQGAPPPGPLPLFPANNWWNLDISSAPVDTNSASFISFINNGGTRRLHPDFGGEESPGSTAVYGMPYAIVDDSQPTKAVTFQYWDESDGVNYSTGQGIPFYPIPNEAITQAHWVEGGAPANVDQRSSNDRHLLMIDCTNKHLYELYNVWYNTSQARWYAGSGAFFDLNTSDRRPDGWTSADAAGLAIYPGLVRHDEVYDSAVTEIRHALRVTVRATNGYVYPGSHRAGSTSGALPMGARLRLKTSVNGSDPALRTSDPNMRKIFRAMQKYGLIVADNGSDMYITGTFDTRWNNDILNPAFATLTASDFEVVQLGWNPPSGPPTMSAVAASPNPVVGGNSSTGSVTLTAAAPAGGALVSLSSSSVQAVVPASVTVPAGVVTANFSITTSAVASVTNATISATYNATTKQTVLTLNPPPPAAALSSLTLNPSTVTGGAGSTGTVTLTTAAPAGGVLVALSNSSGQVSVPDGVTVAAGNTSATFSISTSAVTAITTATISGTYNGVTKQAVLTLNPPPPPPAAVLTSLTLSPTTVVGGASSTGTVTLSAVAPAGGATVTLSSSNTSVATVPASVVIAAGTTSKTFTVTTKTQKKPGSATISAVRLGVTKTASLSVRHK